MERCLWSFLALAVTLSMMGLLTIGLREDGSAVAMGSALPSHKQHWSSKPGFPSEHPLAHERSSYVDGFEGDMGKQAASAYQRQTSGRQLSQAGSNPEVEALMAFKQGITSDPLGVLTSWDANDSNPCHWRGVACGQSSSRVLSLDLGNLLLTGTISPLLGTLQNLQSLNLSVNFFHGGIPDALLNCSQLTNLALRQNKLSGQVPSQLGDFRNLQSLDLSTNFALVGALPRSLGNCTYLEVLHIQFTSLSGEIPETLGQLSHLQSLNMSYTLFSGKVPKALGNCSALTWLDMGNLYDETNSIIQVNDTDVGGLPPSEAYLSGELPAELAQLTRLTTFGIFGSNIGGAFPSWIANLTSLNQLGIIRSSFTGEIPDFLGRLPLELLCLSKNNFTGMIPEAILNCTNLWFLVIEYNPYLTGPIPSGIGVLNKLGSLGLTYNNHTGRVPSSISNCSSLRLVALGYSPFLDPQTVPSWVTASVNLTYLMLDEMNLVGEIPAFVGQISKLDTLSMQGNQLRGVIPDSLGNCTRLLEVNLRGNLLQGEVPLKLWNATLLQSMVLGQNSLTGVIPQSVGNLVDLDELFLADNLFSGEIPVELGMLEGLQVADFSLNNFSGPLPPSLGNSSALYLLNVSQNHLTGSLPPSLGNLTNLQQFLISGNQLEGQIPVDLMKCSWLGNLDLSDNLLVGGIPREIGRLSSIQTLFLNKNQLTGIVPQSLGLCQSLLHLDLSFNKLTGSFPDDVVSNISGGLFSFDVSQNLLSGPLPQQLGGALSLSYLNFSHNDFSGFIPSSFGDCAALETLDLSVNNLSGGIPQNLGQLASLAFVNMSYNDLEGSLPHGGLFNSNNLSAASFAGNPGLCGSIFLKECPTSSNSPINSTSHCKGFHCDPAKVAGVCVGVVAGLVIVLGALLYSPGPRAYFRRRLRDDDRIGPLADFGTGVTVSQEEVLSLVALPENIIGVGQTSTVYKAVLSGGVTVAVKLLHLGGKEIDDNRQALIDLYREGHNLSRIKHRNIVRLLGVISMEKFTALVLEYMVNGSLYKHLYGVEQCLLSWGTRLNIAVGVAEGVFYLHKQAHEPIIHRDLKPGNILLDADLEPKLGDFGISKIINQKKTDQRGETTASRFCGTTGYIPPEYGLSTRVSTSGDVYSFGVIILELVTRKHPVLADNENENFDMQTAGGHLVDLVVATQQTPLAVVDPVLMSNAAGSREVHDQMMMFMQVGLLCTQAEPERRPAMSDVVAMLKQIQERGSETPSRPTVEQLASVKNWASARHLDWSDWSDWSQTSSGFTSNN